MLSNSVHILYTLCIYIRGVGGNLPMYFLQSHCIFNFLVFLQEMFHVTAYGEKETTLPF